MIFLVSSSMTNYRTGAMVVMTVYIPRSPPYTSIMWAECRCNPVNKRPVVSLLTLVGRLLFVPDVGHSPPVSRQSATQVTNQQQSTIGSQISSQRQSFTALLPVANYTIYLTPNHL